MRISIVGGGPAGLVAAIAARRSGFDVTVFEQATSFELVGGAVGIQSNGLRVLDALGLLEDFRPLIEVTYSAGVEAPPGHRLTKVDFTELDIPHRGFAVALRYDLQAVLLQAARAQGVELRFDHRCAHAHRHGQTITLSFTNGSNATTDLVLACDGIRSSVRESVGGFRTRIKNIGEAYLRVVAQISMPDRDRIGEFWAADGRRAGAFPLPGNRTYMFCSVPIGQWRDILQNRLAAWVDSWQDFGEPVTSLMRAVPDWSRAVYDELSDLRVDHWSCERVILLGDAAHAMTPNLGQGANSAMTDALVLVNLLAECEGRGGWEQAGARYEQLRKPFVTRIQDAALMSGRIASWTSAPARGVRDLFFRAGTNIPALRNASMRLTSGYNPTEEAYLHPPVRA